MAGSEVTHIMGDAPARATQRRVARALAEASAPLTGATPLGVGVEPYPTLPGKLALHHEYEC